MARFASQLGFEIESNTFNCAKKVAPRILTVSRERWVGEMDKLLMTDKPSIGLQVLADTRLLNFMFPELAQQVGYDQHSPYHSKLLWEHTLAVVDGAPKDVEIRWAALFHDTGKPAMRTEKNEEQSRYIMHELVSVEIVHRTGLYLRWSNARLKNIMELVANHADESSPLREADKLAH
jgi:tRNA nucleotidyltransferase (CCA-adding enzyme)